MKAYRRDDTPLIDLMRRIGIKPTCDLSKTEQKAIAYAKVSARRAARHREYVAKKGVAR